jgi:glycosyltransferase involved in cell wall biosynthesis
MSAQTLKKCLYLAPFDPTTSSTGTTTRGRLFLRYLARRYETHLVRFLGVSEEGQDDALLDSLASVEKVDSSAWDYFVFSRRFLVQADRVLQRSRCDFIFADSDMAGIYAYWLSKKHRVPYIYNTHNVEFQRFRSMARSNPLRYLLVPHRYMMESLVCKNSSLTIAISQRDADTFQRWVAEPDLLVLPCALDESAINPFYEETETEKPTVLMVGNFGYGANRESVYTVCREILPKVLHQQPDAIFRFVGRNFPDDIRHESIESVGFVRDLLPEYAKASVVIAPIEMGGGLKIKVVEALAAGKMLVTTEKGMEGIDYLQFGNLRVTSRDNFSSHRLDALLNRPKKTVANWDAVAARFGASRSLKGLASRINVVLDNPFTRDHGPVGLANSRSLS